MKTVLTAGTLVTATAIIQNPVVTIDGQEIVTIESFKDAGQVNSSYHFPEATIAAGLFDIHMHGAIGHDVMDDDRAALPEISSFLAHRGITGYLATTVTASLDFTLIALDRIASYMERQPADDEAIVQGIHIEGPFLSHAKRGMHPSEYLLEPTPALFDRLWQAAQGQIRLMTIAPEIPGAIETIAYAARLGVRCSIGHSDAGTAEASAAIEEGAVSATHTFNAMRPLSHREPGILGVVLDRDDLYADLICDGVHVAPELVRLWFKAKGPERAILITDSLEATGMPDGLYKLGQTVVNVKDRRCLTESGVLAGSVLTLDEAVSKFRSFTGADLTTAVRLASWNPARMLGIPCDLDTGSTANFAIWGPNGQRQATVLRGRVIGRA